MQGTSSVSLCALQRQQCIRVIAQVDQESLLAVFGTNGTKRETLSRFARSCDLQSSCRPFCAGSSALKQGRQLLPQPLSAEFHLTFRSISSQSTKPLFLRTLPSSVLVVYFYNALYSFAAANMSGKSLKCMLEQIPNRDCSRTGGRC